MLRRYTVLSAVIGLAILAFVTCLGIALWWLLYLRGSLLPALLSVIGLAVAVLALAIVRRRGGMGWMVLFGVTFSLMLISVMSPLGLGPFLGPLALLLLALSLWELLHPV